MEPPELWYLRCGQHRWVWETEKEAEGKQEGSQKSVVSGKWLPFSFFKRHPVFPISSHTSLSRRILSAILGHLAGYWQKTCEQNWQNSPANSLDPTVSALKIVGVYRRGPCFIDTWTVKPWVSVYNASQEPELMNYWHVRWMPSAFCGTFPKSCEQVSPAHHTLMKGEQVWSLRWTGWRG